MIKKKRRCLKYSWKYINWKAIHIFFPYTVTKVFEHLCLCVLYVLYKILKNLINTVMRRDCHYYAGKI